MNCEKIKKQPIKESGQTPIFYAIKSLDEVMRTLDCMNSLHFACKKGHTNQCIAHLSRTGIIHYSVTKFIVPGSAIIIVQNFSIKALLSLHTV